MDLPPPPWHLAGLPLGSQASAELPALLRQAPEQRQQADGLLYQCQPLEPNHGRSPTVCWNGHWRERSRH
ncbi:MAG: hypothetical protein VKJ87_06590 [Synechococcus sp.]|nr:hypothetical protein [Synechococcus sp.]